MSNILSGTVREGLLRSLQNQTSFAEQSPSNDLRMVRSAHTSEQSTVELCYSLLIKVGQSLSLVRQLPGTTDGLQL